MLATKSATRFQVTVPTRVSAYDRTSAFLTAVSMVLALMIVLLIGLWLSAPTPAPGGQLLRPVPSDKEGKEELAGDKIEEPAAGELPESIPELVSELQSITMAVATVQTDLDSFERGPGLGTSLVGPDPRTIKPTPPFIPESKPSQRWLIEYEATSPAEYMAILAHFNVTLGAVHKVGNQIDYVGDLLAEAPASIQGLRENEKRVYFLNGRNGLQRWDAAKVAAAGIDTQDKILVQFYPDAIVEKLTSLEAAELARSGKDLHDVKQTLFRVRATDSGYRLFVARITY